MATSGPNQGTTASDGGAYGSVAWTNPSDAVVENGTKATAVFSGEDATYLLDVVNFGTFTGVSSGDVITNVLVEVKCRSVTNGGNFAVGDLIIGGTSLGMQIITGGTYSTTLQWQTAFNGAPVADWGKSGELLGSDITSTFGVQFAMYNSAADTVEVDAVRITLTYTPSGGGGATAHNLLLLGCGA